MSFFEYDKEFDKKLDAVSEAHDAFKKALSELHKEYHSLNTSLTHHTDLTAVDYFMEDMDTFMVDVICPLRKEQDQLPGKYDTYDYGEWAESMKLSDVQMGLKTGRR